MAPLVQSGAAAFFDETVVNVTLDNVTMTDGAASTGGGLLLVLPLEVDPTWVRTLRQLHLGHNWAPAGPNLFWMPADNLWSAFPAELQPTCDDCRWDGKSLQSTTAVEYVILEDGTPNRNGVTSDASSGKSLPATLGYAALDFLGEVANLPYDTADGYLTSVSVTSTSEGPLAGTYSVYWLNEAAEFPELVVSGVPGTQMILQFRPQHSEWEVVSVVVPLKECVPGEVYNVGGYRCEPCSNGTIKFTNSTELCTACKTGLTCPGGSAYVVEEGYWLATSAQYCGEDVDCFFKRLYECDVEEACSVSELSQRRGNSAAQAGSLLLCNVDAGYSDGVLCGGTAPPVCRKGYYTQGAKCVECSSVFVSLLVSGITLLVIVVLLKLIYDLLSDVDLSDVQDLAEEFSSDQLGNARDLLAATMGYFQVLGQLGSIFPTDDIPNMFGSFCSGLSFTDLDFAKILNFRCLQSHLFPNMNTEGEFYRHFVSVLTTPWIVLALSAVLCEGLRHFRRWCEGGGGASSAENPRQVRELRMTWLSRALFLLVLVHPSVATTIFQMFRCEDYYHVKNQDEPQKWLWLDRSVQCLDKTWYAAAAFAIGTLLVFIFGFPISLYCIMRYLRRWHKMCIRREDMAVHQQMTLSGKWTPWTPITAAGPLPKEQRGDCAAAGLAGQEDRGGGLGMELDADYFEVYAHKRSFFTASWKHARHDAQEQSTQRRSLRLRLLRICGYHETSDSRTAAAPERPLEEPLQWKIAHEAGSEQRVRSETIVVRGGLHLEVMVFEKWNPGDHGHSASWVPVTRLDSLHTVLGFAFEPFEDTYYFWQ
eukprot:gene18579-22180_t